MRLKYEVEVDAKEIDTQGSHTYLVALCCGGIMEDPEFHYHNFQVIKANTKEEAVETYNKINNCSYYYGTVIKQIN